MSRNCSKLLLIIIVILINRSSLLILGNRLDTAFLHGNIPYICSVIRNIRNLLCNYIKSTSNGILWCWHLFAFLITNERCCLNSYILQSCLCHNIFCQWLQSLFFSNCSSCSSLLLIWSVKILHKNHCLCSHNLFLKFICKLALFLNTCKNLGFPVFQVTKILKSLIQISKLLIIKRASNFLPVSGNKWNCTSLINKLYRSFHLGNLYL